MVASRFSDSGIPSCYYDPAWLRATGSQPHFFGLGFIQLKLEADLRMHFWHPSLQPITGPEEVHNHRYDFHSTILAGYLVHETWDFQSHTHGRTAIIEVSCKPDEPAAAEHLGQGTAHLTGRYRLAPGSTYFFPHSQFHRTIATEAAVTLLERGPIKRTNALVLRPFDAPDVCPFSKTMEPDELWALIAESLS